MGNLIYIPELSIIIVAFFNLMLGAFKAKHSEYIIRILTIVSFIVALSFSITNFYISKQDFIGGMVVHDIFSSYSKIIILAISIVVLFLNFGLSRHLGNLKAFEFPIIMAFSVVGMMLMVSANNLLILYMGLELFSLPLYVMASFEVNNVKSSEAGLKYFILGSFATGILLYGISLIYGFTGSVNFSSFATIVSDTNIVPLAVLVGFVMIFISFFFKISAAPFHMWAPDVYQGAPTLVTLFLSTAPKVAILSVFTRIVIEVFERAGWDFNNIITLVSILSMTVGAIGAINQQNLKRLLAYSSISHIGFALIGLAIGSIDSIQAMLIYIIIYVVMNIGAFAFILSISVEGRMLEEIEEFSGIAKVNLDKGLAILLIMASMAGIPPLAGFFGKFYILNMAIEAKQYSLTFFGVITTIISAYYYLKVIKVVFFNEPLNQNFTKSCLEVKIVLSLSVFFILLFFWFPDLIIKSSFLSALTLLMENL
jgi:NADH-quinone oxidoreductase subunit N